jgi:sugar/nucleoside kinase (ribokinase family)
MLEIAKYCTKTSKPFLLNLGAVFLVKHNFEDMMECIAHADYVFCNQREGAMFAKKHGFDDDIEAAAMYMADYRQKSDSKPPRMAIITQEGEPTIVCKRDKKGELVVTRHEVVQVPKHKIIDTNGAGDTLVGGFIAGLIRGVDETQALKEGLHLASIIIQKHGCDLEN